MDQDKLLLEIRQLCIINFVELQHIKQSLNIPDIEMHEYANSLDDHVKENLQKKISALCKSFPYLLKDEIQE